MNYDELVKALRYCASDETDCKENCPYSFTMECLGKIKQDAAAAIEALQATIELMKPYMPDFFPDANKVTLPKMEVQE